MTRNKKHVNFILFSTVCVLFIFSLLPITNLARTEDVKSVFYWGRQVFIPLIGKNTFDIDKYAGFQDNNKDYINYWINASNAIGFLTNAYYDKDDLSLIKAKEIVTNLMDTYYRHGYFPRPKYENFDYGWVSCMDAPVILLASQMIYEITGDIQYKKFRDDLKEIILRRVPENGFIFEDENNFWMFEYADKNTNPQNGKYVLNGSLVGYQALSMVARAIDDEDYLELCEKQLKSYKENLHKYWYKDDEWSYYMLNPKKVNPPHYMIFEKKLFESLYKIEKDPFFYKEALKRENALRQILPLYAFENDNNENILCLLRAAAPHPYLLDIYHTYIEILDANKSVIQTFYESRTGSISKEEFEKGMFMLGKLKDGATYYRIYASNGEKSEKYLLFESKIRKMKDADYLKLTNTMEISGDLGEKDDLLYLRKELSEDNKGIIKIDLDKPIMKNVYSYIGIEIEMLNGNSVPVSIVFYDNNKNGITRYYTQLIKGKNLILLSYLGFIENENIQEISNIRIRLHTNNFQDDEEILLKVNNVILYNNAVEIYKYLCESEYKVNPQ